MARRRKKKHEEGGDGERWAIPYADFVTLLLAFFVCMYAVSSINEGKYRVLSQALAAAFSGTPRSFEPIQLGNHTALAQTPEMLKSDTQSHTGSLPISRASRVIDRPIGQRERIVKTIVKSPANPSHPRASRPTHPTASKPTHMHGHAAAAGDAAGLDKIADKIEAAIAPLIKKNLIVVRRSRYWLEVEIKTDILFPSGVAKLSSGARPILRKLAGILAPFPNLVHVEGHTDNVPIHTSRFPSNWELSAARAASVARLLVRHGVDPHRLAIIGFSKYRPIADNSTAEGRNQNRRVTLVVLGDSDTPVQVEQEANEKQNDSPKTVASSSEGQLSEGGSDAHLGGS